MRKAELLKAATCAMCQKPFGHTGLPLFWRVTIERHGVDMRAARRSDGLAMMIGAAIADIMGPDEEITKPMMEPVTITVCEECALTPHCVAAMSELAPAAQEEQVAA